ncbi:acyltransferase family protein, partial [Prevotella histicola]
MKRNIDIDCFRAVLISLVILVHVVNFGNLYPLLKNSILAFIMPAFLVITGYLVDVD